MTKTVNMFPEMEYVGPRRVTATPITAKEAGERNIKKAYKSSSPDELGYLVKEPAGEIVFEYWIPAEKFEKSHVRTKQFTIGEAILLLLEGATLQRTSWGGNRFIRFQHEKKDSVETIDEMEVIKSFGAHIVQLDVFPDAIKKDKLEVIQSSWVPTTGDLFATDFQIVSTKF